MNAFEKIAGLKELSVLEAENLQVFMDEKFREKALNKSINFLQQNT